MFQFVTFFCRLYVVNLEKFCEVKLQMQFFAETLKKLRIESGLSQQELAEKIFVSRPTITRWENGNRLPDSIMMLRLAKILKTDLNTLFSAALVSEDAPNIIMVDDRKIFLTAAIPILEEILPNAIISGFTRPSEAIEFAKSNQIALAFLDVELGKTNGLDLCKILLKINPRTNVIYLTNYIEYSFDAWSTGASGFLLKPITSEKIQEILKNLRYPFALGENFNE